MALRTIVLLGVALLAQAPASAQGRIPQNASSDGRGGWNCDSGYVKRGAGCVTVAGATDAEIRQFLMARSIAAYSGSCPCPHNTDRAGRRCGARSAYSRPGGSAPLCFESDVTKSMVDGFRKSARRP